MRTMRPPEIFEREPAQSFTLHEPHMSLIVNPMVQRLIVCPFPDHHLDGLTELVDLLVPAIAVRVCQPRFTCVQNVFGFEHPTLVYFAEMKKWRNLRPGVGGSEVFKNGECTVFDQNCGFGCFGCSLWSSPL